MTQSSNPKLISDPAALLSIAYHLANMADGPGADGFVYAGGLRRASLHEAVKIVRALADGTLSSNAERDRLRRKGRKRKLAAKRPKPRADAGVMFIPEPLLALSTRKAQEYLGSADVPLVVSIPEPWYGGGKEEAFMAGFNAGREVGRTES